MIFRRRIALLAVFLLGVVGPVSAQQSAAPAAEKLRSIFAEVETFRDVKVEAKNGVIVLTGDVLAIEARDEVEKLARGMDGVLYVENHVEASLDVAKRLQPNFSKMLGWLREAMTALPLFAVALAVVVAFWFLAKFVANAEWAFRRLTPNRLLQGLLRQSVRGAVLVLGIYVALELVGATALVGAVLGTAGVIGLALGFAFRDIVENYLASIILSVRRPFAVKDLVQIGESMGSVVRMTTRDTVLMTAEGNHVVLPNSVVFKESLTNYSRNPLRRFDVAVGVGTREDLVAVQRLGIGVLRDLRGVVADPAPFARIHELGDSTVTVRFYGWVDQQQNDFQKVKSEATRLVKTVMDDHGVDLPEPIYRIELQRREAAAKPAEPRVPAEIAERVDLAPETHIDRQVENDRRMSEEDDLLSDAS